MVYVVAEEESQSESTHMLASVPALHAADLVFLYDANEQQLTTPHGAQGTSRDCGFPHIEGSEISFM
jgi:hypothetical protein